MKREPIQVVKGGLTHEYVDANDVGHWTDGPDTFIVTRARNVLLGAQTFQIYPPSKRVHTDAVNCEVLTPNSVWTHNKTWEDYRVDRVDNLAATWPDYVAMVSYTRLSDGTTWSRPLSEWSNSMVPKKDPA